MARNEEDSAISLFSFQDIITSLTGIMFLVVLMLLLVVLSPHGFLLSEVDPETKALQREVQTLRAELEKLSNSRDALAQELEKLRALSESELAARLEAARAKLAELKARSELDERKLRALLAQLEKMKLDADEVTAIMKSLQETVPELEKANDALAKEVKETTGRIRRREKIMNFTVPRPSGKTPRLIELSVDGVRILSPEDGAEEDFRMSGSAEMSLTKLKHYLDAHRGEGIYFCVVVRPDGFRMAWTLLTLLDRSGFERGIEFLPSNDLTIFPEVAP